MFLENPFRRSNLYETVGLRKNLELSPVIEQNKLLIQMFFDLSQIYNETFPPDESVAKDNGLVTAGLWDTLITDPYR